MSSIDHPNRIRRGALLVVLSGALTVITILVLVIYSGSNPKPHTHPNAHGFNSALIWLELAADRGEVTQILGPASDTAGKAIREALDRANQVDFAFMVAYSALNACIFILCNLLNSSQGRGILISPRVLNVGLVLALLMLVGDVFETIQLLRLTGSEYPDSALTILNIATRVKWAALFLASLLFGLAYSAYFRFSWGLIIALAYTVCAVLGFMSISINSARALLEPASGLMGLGWILSFAHAIIILVKKPTPNRSAV